MSLGVISLQNYGVLNETLRNYPWCNTIDWSVEWTWIYSVFVSLSFFCFRIQSWVCIAFIVFFFLSLLLSAAQWFLSLRIIFLWVLATYFVECTEFGFVGCCLMIRLSFNLFWIVSSKCACIICMNEYSKHFLALRNQFGIVGWKVIWKLRPGSDPICPGEHFVLTLNKSLSLFLLELMSSAMWCYIPFPHNYKKSLKESYIGEGRL